MPVVSSSSPVLDISGVPIADRPIRVYRRDSGVLLATSVTANGLPRTETHEWTPTTTNAGWSGYTLRVAIDFKPSIVSTGVRIRFAGTASAPITIGKLYVGKRAGAGSGFSETPTQATFLGSATATVPTNGVVLSDVVPFDLSAPLLLSMYFSGTTTLPQTTVGVSWGTYYQTGDVAAALNPGGFSSNGSQYGPTGIVFTAPELDVGAYQVRTDYAGTVNVVCLDPTEDYADKILRTTPV